MTFLIVADDWCSGHQNEQFFQSVLRLVKEAGVLR